MTGLGTVFKMAANNVNWKRGQADGPENLRLQAWLELVTTWLNNILRATRTSDS